MERVPVSLSLIYLVSLATSQREYEFEQSSSKPRTENRKRRAKNPSLGGTSSKLHALQKDNPKYFVFIPPLSSSSSSFLTRNSKFFQRFRSNSRLVSPRFNRIVIVCLCIRKGVVSTRPVTISLCVRIADAVRYVYIHYIRIFEHSLLHLPRLRLPRIIRLYIVCTILSSSIASPFFFHFIISRNILSIDAYRIYLSLASLPLVFVRTSPESPSSSRGSRGSWIFAAPPPPPPPPR